MNAKSLSLEEKLVSFIVSIAHLYFLFARANCGANDSMGHDSSDCSALEYKCLASNTHLIESPLGIIMRGFK